MKSMKLKEYKGKRVRLLYPDFLKIKSGEPEWSAFGPGSGSALILIDPEPVLAQAQSEVIRSQDIISAPGFEVEVIRRGDFHSAKGIAGFERVVKITDGMGQASWTWEIDGKANKARTVIVRICVPETYWHDGRIWEEFINSIDVAGDLVQGASDTPATVPTGDKVLSHPKRKREGVLLELPKNLDYLLELAFEIGSLPQEDLEDNPELTEALERHLKREMHGLGKEKARARVKADRERLWEWLKQYPADKHPETGSLYVVAGALLYADGVFK